jgi:hypothetical protein
MAPDIDTAPVVLYKNGKPVAVVMAIDVRNVEELKPEQAPSYEEGHGLATLGTKLDVTEGAPAAPVTFDLARVKKAFPGAKVTGDERRGYKVVYGGARPTFTVQFGEPEVTERAIKEHGLENVPRVFLRVRGGFDVINGEAVIQLGKAAEDQTLDHEIMHAAMALVLTAEERGQLLQKYGNDEGVAKAYADWNPSKPSTIFEN